LPAIQQVVLGYDNSLAELDVDIVLDVTDDTATLAAEEFQTLSELARIYGPQEVPFDDMLELSSLPDKRKLMEKRKARQEAAQQQGGQGQQMQMQAAQVEIMDKAASAGSSRPRPTRPWPRRRRSASKHRTKQSAPMSRPSETVFKWGRNPPPGIGRFRKPERIWQPAAGDRAHRNGYASRGLNHGQSGISGRRGSAEWGSCARHKLSAAAETVTAEVGTAEAEPVSRAERAGHAVPMASSPRRKPTSP
jgi:hypothetical protein